MVRRSERCLGSRLNKIRSNKDDPIIDDNTKGDEADLRGPTGTQIVVYHERQYVETNVNNEGETEQSVELNFSSEFDKDNVPIDKGSIE
uniref:Uncharacterized protein n=1 Tax=Cucumis melo TaxID=3656 RepID=A0A9I9ED61_CUCME